jgi:hypothetical protein
MFSCPIGRLVRYQANHTFEPACSAAISADGTSFDVDVYQASNVAKGAELTVSYGDTRINQVLMENYGAQQPN